MLTLQTFISRASTIRDRTFMRNKILLELFQGWLNIDILNTLLRVYSLLGKRNVSII